MLDPTSPGSPSLAGSLSAVLTSTTVPPVASPAAQAAPGTLHVGRPNIGNPERFLELARGHPDGVRP